MNTVNVRTDKSYTASYIALHADTDTVLYSGESYPVNPLLAESSFDNFETASRAVLEFLHQRMGFSLWMVTRVEGGQWIALQTIDNGYGVNEGDVFQWADSFCSRMINDEGPRIACDAQEIPAYDSAPINRQMPIGAYVGVPISKSNGELFGTLCAIDPVPKSRSIEADLPLLELLAGLLGTILDRDIEAIDRTKELDVCRNEAVTDKLTGLLNRTGWENFVSIEETRAKRYGISLGVFVLDVDDLKVANDTHGHNCGDDLLRSIGDCLRSVLRKTDIAARIGGDEFAILLPDYSAVDIDAIGVKISQAFAERDIPISLGWAMRSGHGSLVSAIAEADRRMYENKAERKIRWPVARQSRQ